MLLQFLRRGENLFPPFVLPLEARAEIFHLVLVSRCRIPGRAASDIRASRRARAKRDVDVKVVRVVVNPVGVANRVRRMKPLVELPHDFLRRGLQHAVGIDSGFDQLVVQLARHREDEPMLNDGILRGGRKFPDVLEPRLGNAPLAFVVGQLRRRGAAAVLVEQDQMVQESARVNLAERFLRGVIGELLERAVVLFGPSSCCWRGETFRLEVSSRYSRSRRLRHVVLRAKIIPAFIGSSKFSRTRSSLASMRRRICGSILSLIDTAKRTASNVAAFVLKPNASWSAEARFRLGGNIQREGNGAGCVSSRHLFVRGRGS